MDPETHIRQELADLCLSDEFILAGARERRGTYSVVSRRDARSEVVSEIGGHHTQIVERLMGYDGVGEAAEDAVRAFRASNIVLIWSEETNSR
jgi:hypothetical protein